MPDSNTRDGDYQPRLEDLISLQKAVKLSGLTRQHLALLIRQGKLWGSKLGGRDWYTTEEAVREYLARDRRTGPKTQNSA